MMTSVPVLPYKLRQNQVEDLGLRQGNAAVDAVFGQRFRRVCGTSLFRLNCPTTFNLASVRLFQLEGIYTTDTEKPDALIQ